MLSPAWFPPFPHVERQDGMGGEIPGRLAARHETVEGRTECSPAPPAATSASSCFCWQAFPQGIVHSWPACNCRMPAVNNTHVQDGRICELRAASPELGVMPSLVFGGTMRSTAFVPLADTYRTHVGLRSWALSSPFCRKEN